MSMNKLSTELDCRIARFLVGDNKTLSALSRVSKYYRKVMEPFLYEALNFLEDDNHSLQCLLFTLLDRPDLANEVINFSQAVTKPRNGPQVSRYSLNGRNWPYAEKIRGKINEILDRAGKGYDHAYKVFWFVKVLGDGSNAVDAILALILCLLPNLSSLRLSNFANMDITLATLGISRQDSDVAPFTKLNELFVHKYFSSESCTVLPPIEVLAVENIRRAWGEWAGVNQTPVSRYWQPFYFPSVQSVVTSIRTIVLVGLELATPKAIVQMISSPSLVTVKELVVKSCGMYYELTNQVHDKFDMPALLRAVERYVPNLEHFEFTRSTPLLEAPQFDNFTNLKKLRSLAISLNMIAHQEEASFETIFKCYNVFPEGLEYLTLENFKVDQLSERIQQFRVESGDGDDQTEAYPLLVQSLAPNLQLKGLAIAIDMDTYGTDYHTGVLELDPEDVAFFRDMADELMKTGVNFEVFRAPGPSNLFYKLLVKPGWTAPCPHSLPGAKKRGDRLTFLNNDRVWDL